MLGSTLLRRSRSFCNLWTVSAVQVSSTYHFQKGMSVVARALSSTSYIIGLAIVTDSGDHMAVP